MKQFLLPENGNFYKANLHCHTDVSDGKATPEQVKDIYKRHGYSIVAFTDHNVQVPHPELRDPDFLPLTGTEYNINAPGYPGKIREVKTCHLCFIATRDDIPYQVCYTDSYVTHGRAREFIPLLRLNPDEPDFPREYFPDCVNKMIQAGADAGYFVTYNHPTWSQEDYGDYMRYHGMHAMEIFNNDCIVNGYAEYDNRVYDDMLRGGEKLFCVASDDNHNKYPEGDPLCDSCGGWVMIKADELEYNTIGKALLDGHFYASTGPEIRSLWFDGTKLFVECSAAESVNLIYGVKKAVRRAAAGEERITSASFTLNPLYRWFRVHIEDGRGHFADSHAYFMDDLSFEKTE